MTDLAEPFPSWLLTSVVERFSFLYSERILNILSSIESWCCSRSVTTYTVITSTCQSGLHPATLACTNRRTVEPFSFAILQIFRMGQKSPLYTVSEYRGGSTSATNECTDGGRFCSILTFIFTVPSRAMSQMTVFASKTVMHYDQGNTSGFMVNLLLGGIPSSRQPCCITLLEYRICPCN